jgi:hypothetical protein
MQPPPCRSSFLRIMLLMRKSLVRVAPLERSIHVLRGQRVMLDEDLARLYGVETKRLNEAVKRNKRRFPQDFAFRLKAAEAGVV